MQEGLFLNEQHLKTGEDYEETGSIIIKTFWLKMVQRSWKKTYKQRLEWIKKNY